MLKSVIDQEKGPWFYLLLGFIPCTSMECWCSLELCNRIHGFYTCKFNASSWYAWHHVISVDVWFKTVNLLESVHTTLLGAIVQKEIDVFLVKNPPSYTTTLVKTPPDGKLIWIADECTAASTKTTTIKSLTFRCFW